MVSKKCLDKGLGFINKLNHAKKITENTIGGYYMTILDTLARYSADLEKYKDDIEDIAKTTKNDFETQGWADDSYEKAKKLERKIIKDAFDAVIDCEKIVPEYEEEWGQWWDGMDSSERKELSKKISVRSVDFFELTEEEKEAIRSHAGEEGIL